MLQFTFQNPWPPLWTPPTSSLFSMKTPSPRQQLPPPPPILWQPLVRHHCTQVHLHMCQLTKSYLPTQKTWLGLTGTTQCKYQFVKKKLHFPFHHRLSISVSLWWVSLSLTNRSRYESRSWIKNKSNNHDNGKQFLTRRPWVPLFMYESYSNSSNFKFLYMLLLWWKHLNL